MSNKNNVTMEAQRQSAILAHDLKDKVRNLAIEYNTHTNLRNQQEKILNKYNDYISLQNKKINKQLDKLEDIESHIATRDALVRGNQSAYLNKEKKIHVLKVFFIVIAYLVFIITAYLGNKIGIAFLLTNIIFVLIFYAIYVAWYYDIFDFKSFTFFVSRDLEEMKRDIYEEGRHIEEQINQYINDECDCPVVDHNKKKYKIPTKHHIPGSLPYNDGIYYYDGTAPQERIYPMIPDLSKKYNPDNYDNQTENPNKFKIDWKVAPDFGSRQNYRYTPNPKWMKTSAGLPKTTYKEENKKCSKQYEIEKNQKNNYWTTDL